MRLCIAYTDRRKTPGRQCAMPPPRPGSLGDASLFHGRQLRDRAIQLDRVGDVSGNRGTSGFRSLTPSPMSHEPSAHGSPRADCSPESIVRCTTAPKLLGKRWFSNGNRRCWTSRTHRSPSGAFDLRRIVRAFQSASATGDARLPSWSRK